MRGAAKLIALGLLFVPSVSHAAFWVWYSQCPTSLQLRNYAFTQTTQCYDGSNYHVFTGAMDSRTGGGPWNPSSVRTEYAVANGTYNKIGPCLACGGGYLVRLDDINDTTPPLPGTVNDGTGADIDTQLDPTSISANWSGFSDPDSYIDHYEWAIGTTPGGTQVRPFAIATSPATATGLSLTVGLTYYVTVRAFNASWVPTDATSNGVTLTTLTSKLVFVTPSRTFVAGNCEGAAGVIQVQLQDSGNNPLPATSDLNLGAATTSSEGLFYTDESCSVPAVGNTFVIPAGQTTVNLYYVDTLAWSPGYPRIHISNSVGHINPTPQEQSVVAGPAAQLGFYTPSLALEAGKCAGAGAPIKVQLQDAYGNAVIAGVGGESFTPTSNSTGTFGFFTDSNCTTPAPGGVFTILSGDTMVNMYYRDTRAGYPAVSLSNSSGLLNPAPQQHWLIAGSSNNLAWLTPARTFVAGGCGGAANVVTIQLQDANANPVLAGVGGVSVTAASDSAGPLGWYSDSTCSTPAVGGAFSIAEGSSTVDIFYVDRLAGTPLLSVTNGSGLVDPNPQLHTVVSADASVMEFSTSAQSLTAGACSAVADLRMKDAYGNLANVSTDTTIDLTSSSSTLKFFSDPGCGTEVTSRTVTAGGNAASFYFMDTKAGSPQVTASATGFASVNQSQTISVGPPAVLVKESGDGQLATVGASLVQPFVVRVEDAFGNPVAGTLVTFSEVSGGGLVSPASTLSALNGQASATATLGTTAGANSFTASSSGLTSITFSATGLAGAAAALVKVSGDLQGSTVASTLGAPLVVRVEDSYGNPVAGQAVNFTVGSGGGSISPGSVMSAASGQASATATLGTVAGTNTFIVSAGALPSLTFDATATEGAAAALVKLSGDLQNAPAGAALPSAFVLRVEDSFGNPVAGALVDFSVASGGGSISPTSAASAANGTVSATATLGALPGANSFTASFGALPSLTFNATATGGPPALLVVTTPARTFVAGACPGASSPVTVELRDSVGNVAQAGPGGVALTAWSDSTGTTSWYQDAGCGTPAAGGLFTLAAGQSSIELYYVDSKAGSPALALSNSAGLVDPSPQVHTVVAGPADRLVFATPARTFTAGQCAGATNVISVALEDAFGNSVLAGAGGLPLVASSSSAAANWYEDAGCATPAVGGAFVIPGGASSVELYYLDTLSGSPQVSLSAALTSPPAQTHSVLASSVAALSFLVQPGNVAAGQPLSPGVQVAFIDSFGNLASGVSSAVSLALVDLPSSGGSLSGTTSRNASGGVALFDDLWVDKVGSGYALLASATGLSNAQSAAFNVTAGAAARLALTATPVGTVATHPLSPAPVVTVLDAFGNLASFAQPLTLEAASGPGALSGTTSLVPAGGTASFGSVQLDTPGTGYVLRAIGAGLTSATGASFDVTPTVTASPATFSVSSGATVALAANYGKPPYTWSAVSSGSGGALNGTSWQAGALGHSQDVLQVTDSLGDTALTYVNVANHVPTVSLQGPLSVLPGTSGLLRATAQDADGDSLSYAFSQLAGPAVSLSSSGATATFQVPLASSAAALVFAVDASDGFGGTVRALVSVKVVVSGTPPAITSAPRLAGEVGSPYLYDDDQLPTASGDGPLVWTGSIWPAQASFGVSSVSGRVFWLPQVEGTYQLHLKVQNSAGVDEQQFEVQIQGFTPPVIARSANTSAAVGAAYTFDENGLLEATGTRPMRWSLVEGPKELFVDPSTGLITWLPLVAGLHQVTVRADNREGGDTYSFAVDVKALPSTPPSASAAAEPSSGPVPLAVSFDASSSVGTGNAQIISYRWDFGDGTPPVFSATPPVHRYLKPAGYVARLEVTDALGAQAEISVPISAMDADVSPPTARIQRLDARIGDGTLTITFACDCQAGTSELDSFVWDYGDGDSSTLRSPTHTFRPAGRYQVRLLVTDKNGLASEDTVEVVVEDAENLPPFGRLSVTPSVGPAPLLVHFSQEYGDPDGIIQKLKLTLDGQAISPDEAASITLTGVGEHEACLEVQDADGVWARDCVTVDVQTPEGISMPKLVSQPSRTGQVGVPYMYDEDGAASAVGSRPYGWALGVNIDGQLVGAPEGMTVDQSSGKISWTPTAAGRFRVVLRVANSAGASTQAFEIHVAEPPSNANPAGQQAQGCGCASGGASGGASSVLWALALVAFGLVRPRTRRA